MAAGGPFAPLHWGILSTGRIAGTFAKSLKDAAGGQILQAVGSRDQGKANRFGDEFGVRTRHGSYEALLADPAVTAVYVATPHPEHAPWAIRAAEAGKHVLCEKPLGLNRGEGLAMIEAARRHGVFLMEAFMYRCHPQTAKLVELVRERAIGDLKVIQATFSFATGPDPRSRLLDPGLGGGGILDVGCYPVSMARLLAGAAAGLPVAEPVEVRGSAHLGPTGVDEAALATLRFSGGVLAELATGVRVNQENVVRVFGTDGWLLVTTPWGLGTAGGTTRILLHRPGRDPEEIRIEAPKGAYAYEAEEVAAAVAAGRSEALSPAMTWDDSLGNLRVLDRWREAVGLAYDADKPETGVKPAHRRPLAKDPKAPMTYGKVPGVDREISRLVMGTMGGSYAEVAVMYDDFFELGGNAFDTAYIYGGGKSEQHLGWWIKHRGVRDRVAILAKGAHTPHCNPKALSAQLLESLDRLRTDRVELYAMHRDNPDVPVGEFVDVLDAHARAGRIGVFGGSNWTIERLEAANAWAAKHGKQPFGLVSNNFSLARMVEAPWHGCLAASTPAWRAWLERTKLPLFSWSSQARGFFTGRARPDDRSDAELVRCWYAEDNFERLKRAGELAAKRGVLPINVALAYVLCQPFPAFALVGPATPHETWTTLPGLSLELSPADLRWLNLDA